MTDARELAQEAWTEYLAALTRELLNAPVSIEIIATRNAEMLERRHLALQGLTYDNRVDVFEIAAARGGARRPHILRHMVDHPTRIAVDNRTMLAPMTIAVDGRDGVRTVINIEREPDSFD